MHASLTADATAGIDEEFAANGRHGDHCCGSSCDAYAGGPGAFDTHTAHTLYSGIFEIGSCAAIVS
jgi:hypothetical protein